MVTQCSGRSGRLSDLQAGEGTREKEGKEQDERRRVYRKCRLKTSGDEASTMSVPQAGW